MFDCLICVYVLKMWVCSDLFVVERVLRRVNAWRRKGWWELPDELFAGGCGGVRVVCVRVVAVRRDDAFGQHRLVVVGQVVVRGRLHDRLLRVLRMVILPLAQLAADKTDRNHGTVAPDHFLFANFATVS